TASSAVTANQANVRPASPAMLRWPCRLATALITAKNTSGVAIILIRLMYSVPSGCNQVAAAGPSSQPARPPSTKPPITRCQNGIRNQAFNIVVRPSPPAQSAGDHDTADHDADHRP